MWVSVRDKTIEINRGCYMNVGIVFKGSCHGCHHLLLHLLSNCSSKLKHIWLLYLNILKWGITEKMASFSLEFKNIIVGLHHRTRKYDIQDKYCYIHTIPIFYQATSTLYFQLNSNKNHIFIFQQIVLKPEYQVRTKTRLQWNNLDAHD